MAGAVASLVRALKPTARRREVVDPGDSRELLRFLCETVENAWLDVAKERARELVRLVNSPEAQTEFDKRVKTIRDELGRAREQLQDDGVSVAGVLVVLHRLVHTQRSQFDSISASEVLSRHALSFMLQDAPSVLFDKDKPLAERLEVLWSGLTTPDQRQQRQKDALEEHLEEWRKHVNSSIREELEEKIRKAYHEGIEANHHAMDSFLESFKQEFLGLRTQLLAAQQERAQKGRVVGNTGADQVVRFRAGERFVPRLKDDGWFDGTMGHVLSYLRGQASEQDVCAMVEEERLEEDRDAILQCVRDWVQGCIDRLRLPRLQEGAVVGEVHRGWLFVKALILNDDEHWEQHRLHLARLEEDARNRHAQENEAPVLSLGRLEDGSGTVQVRFIVEDRPARDRACEFLGKLAERTEVAITRQKKPKSNEVVVTFALQGNKAQKIAEGLASRLAELARIKAKCVLVGDFGVSAVEVLNPLFNRIYGNGPEQPGYRLTGNFELSYSGEQYHPPVGWKRISLLATELGTPSEFDRKFGQWHVAYHGTSHFLAATILATGMRPTTGCFSENKTVVYFSPSITYASHPRYAKVYKHNGKFIQMVFQVRVNPAHVWKKVGGTLAGTFPESDPKFDRERDVDVDRNFEGNENLEWLVKAVEGMAPAQLNERFVIYGIMVRETDHDPRDDPSNAWWRYHDNEQPSNKDDAKKKRKAEQGAQRATPGEQQRPGIDRNTRVGVTEGAHCFARNNMSRAMRCFEECDEGHCLALAYKDVMRCFPSLLGKGTIPGNDEEATVCARKALKLRLDELDAGDMSCHVQFCLGVMHYCFGGLGVGEDRGKAFQLFEKAADQGHALAVFWRGMCLRNGHGVVENAERGVEWLQQAVDQGCVHAQTSLAFCYYFGRGVPAPDHSKAAKWFRRAAHHGDPWAQYWLGILYRDGKGVGQDAPLSALLFQKAGRQGHEYAATAFDRTRRRDRPCALHTAQQVERYLARSGALGALVLVASPEMGTDELTRICDSVKANGSVRELHLDKCGIGDDGAATVLQVLRDCRSLVEVCVAGNNLSQDNLDQIEEACVRNQCAQQILRGVGKVDLRGNRVGAEGARLLADALKRNPRITGLWLQGCGIGDEGVDHLLQVLDHCASLVELRVEDNGVSQDNLRLVNSLNQHFACARRIWSGSGIVDISGMSLNDEEAIRAATFALARAPGASGLNLDGNGLGNDGARLWLGLLKDFPRIVAVSINRNDIDAEGAKEIVELLECNTSLQNLTCEEGNSIGPAELGAIRGLLERNRLSLLVPAPVHQARLLVCGSDQSGKATLLESLATIKARRTSLAIRERAQSIQTDGQQALSSVSVNTVSLGVDGRVKCSAWDCSWARAHGLFDERGADGGCEGEDVFLVLCDLGADDWEQQLTRWLRFVKRRHDTSAMLAKGDPNRPQVMIVGTKLDHVKRKIGSLEPWRSAVQQQREQFQDWMDIDDRVVEVDARKCTSSGVRALRDNLRDLLVSSFRDLKVPAVCKLVVEEMSALRRECGGAVVALDALRDKIRGRCRRLGDKELDATIAFLHRIGEVIWLRRDEKGRGVVVVDPHTTLLAPERPRVDGMLLALLTKHDIGTVHKMNDDGEAVMLLLSKLGVCFKAGDWGGEEGERAGETPREAHIAGSPEGIWLFPDRLPDCASPDHLPHHAWLGQVTDQHRAMGHRLAVKRPQVDAILGTVFPALQARVCEEFGAASVSLLCQRMCTIGMSVRCAMELDASDRWVDIKVAWVDQCRARRASTASRGPVGSCCEAARAAAELLDKVTMLAKEVLGQQETDQLALSCEDVLESAGAALPSLTVARRYHAAVVAPSNRVVVVGGEGGDGCTERLEHDHSAWRTALDLPTPRYHCGACAVGALVVVVGGYNRADRGKHLDVVQAVDAAGGAPMTLPSLPKGLSGCGVVSVQDKVVVVTGGYDGQSYVSDVWALEVGSSSRQHLRWMSLAAMPQDRAFHGAAAGDGLVFVCGGECSGDHLDSCAMLRVVEGGGGGQGEWNELPALPNKLCHVGCCFGGGKVFVVGGYPRDGLVFALSEDKRQWTQVAELATGRQGCAAVCVGRRVLVLGGHNDDDGYLNSCEAIEF